MDKPAFRFTPGAALCSLLLFAPMALASTPTGMAPLPAPYLKGTTFNSPDGWFKVDSPPGNWEWFEMRAFDGNADPRWPDPAHHTVGWYAHDTKSGESFVVLESYSPSAAPMDEEYMQGIRSGTLKSATAEEQMSDFTIERLSVPTEDTVRYTYKVVKKGGATIYRYAYATGRQRKVFIESFGETLKEPPLFTRAAVSLRWLKTP
jgi:hypothetical protein